MFSPTPPVFWVLCQTTRGCGVFTQELLDFLVWSFQRWAIKLWEVLSDTLIVLMSVNHYCGFTSPFQTHASLKKLWIHQLMSTVTLWHSHWVYPGKLKQLRCYLYTRSMVAPFNGDSDVIWNHLVSLCCRHCKNIYKEVSKNVNFESRNLNITAASEFSSEGGNTTVILVRGERIHTGPTKTFDRHCIAWKTHFGITFSDACSANRPRAHPLRGYSAGVDALLRNVSCSDQ